MKFGFISFLIGLQSEYVGRNYEINSSHEIKKTAAAENEGFGLTNDTNIASEGFTRSETLINHRRPLVQITRYLYTNSKKINNQYFALIRALPSDCSDEMAINNCAV